MRDDARIEGFCDVFLSPVIPRVNPLFETLDVLDVCYECALLCCIIGIVASNAVKRKNVSKGSVKKTGTGNDSKFRSVA